MALTPGEKLGRYEIRSKIGAGGMGEVYLAEDTQLGRRVAIKLLPDEILSNENAQKRLVREARAAATLDHPHICSVFEVGEANGRSFIVMQFIEGETLETRIKSKPLALKESLTIAVQIADALSEAHSHNIIHRDIKPANIMVTPRGQAKVMDFGLARINAGAAEGEAETQSLLTTPGTILGTMPYMSPEQVRGEVLDARSDIFSFGIVLYEMLTGRQPFASESAAETLAAIQTREPLPLVRYATDVPDHLQRIVKKALAKDRDLRYQTMRDVTTDVDNCRREHETAQATGSLRDAGETVMMPAVDLKRHNFPSSRGMLMAGALLALLVTAALAYVFVFRRGATTERPLEIKSLAVLPLKSLDAGENYLGLGIADAVIRRINQTGRLIVRPTSAVRRYLNEETDALTAARQLNTDAVLEGSVQRADDRLRVSVNLLRASDGMSLWSESFEMRMTDIFTIQDTVAQQVASRLRLQLDPSQQAQLKKRVTSNPVAYEFYLKGVYSFDQRVSFAKPQWESTIGFFKQAIEADPNFALAHAQLAYTYATKAVFVEPTQPAWAERAKEEINRAEAMDSQLAETHLARFQLLFSGSEGYQGEAAVREILLAQQLDPNAGHGELAYLYLHLGLEDLGARELQRAFEIDPTSEFAKAMTLLRYEVGCKYDEYAAHRDLYHDDDIEVVFLMGTGRLDEVQKAIEKWSAKNPDDLVLPARKAVLSALKGDFRTAEAAIPAILGRHPVKDPLYHHAAYDIARVYALQGKSDEAVKWLREAATTGFPCYPLFERDAYLNRIRQAPEFIQFLAEMKAQNERYQREFGEGATR
jgi:eukaryotic-like serine/threonine-protein kinase